MLSPSDIIEIQQLLAEYGNIIDEREWDRVPELFTDDAVYDTSDFGGGGVLHGPGEIRDYWENVSRHPLAHHITNVVVREDDDGTVRVFSKILGVGHRNKAGSATYRDVVQRTDAGWKIAHRIATPKLSEIAAAAQSN